MIAISYPLAIFIYMTLWLTLLLVLWFRSLLRRRRFHWQINSGRLFDCDRCHYAFLTREEMNLTRCPRCNSICIRRKRRHDATLRP